MFDGYAFLASSDNAAIKATFIPHIVLYWFLVDSTIIFLVINPTFSHRLHVCAHISSQLIHF